eukprot:7417307-Ditylum_brightwellii.AAC.1
MAWQQQCIKRNHSDVKDGFKKWRKGQKGHICGQDAAMDSFENSNGVIESYCIGSYDMNAD